MNIPIAYITDFIVQNVSIGIFSLRILTEVTWNILTTTVASCNIPTAYLALSCQSEFILTEVTWNIFIKLMLVRLFQLSFETPLLKDVMLSYSQAQPSSSSSLVLLG